MAVPDLQQYLRDFLERRHPHYESMLAHWDFLLETYKGGREWFVGNIFKYIKEGEQEYNDRVGRAYRFNHTREVVDLVQKYIFKSPVIRNEEDAPQEVKDFWENATLSGLDINQFMSLVSTESSTLGKPWVVVDSTSAPGILSVADAKAARARVYAYIVRPQDVLDVGFDEQGDVNWILIREFKRDDEDPIFSSGGIKEQFRLWERHAWTLFEYEIQKKNKKPVVKIVDEQFHGLGVVPAFPADHIICDEKYVTPALIADIAYLDRAVANYLSNLDAIIQDQSFSQLAMPAQALLPGDDEYKKLLEMGTKRIFTYDGEGGAAPQFLSPDPKQAGVIIMVINKIIAEIYHTIGMAGERTKQDNAQGIDNSSGVAKAYDFERMNSLLTSKADALENIENKLVALIMAWHRKPAPEKELVKYPDTFDVRSLFDEFTVAERLALIDAPQGMRQEQMKQVIDKLFPRLAADLKKKLEAELKSWPPKIDPLAAAPARPGAPKPRARNPQTQNRQGQA